MIYAALVAAVAGYTVLIWNERPEIEGYGYPTGLGDGEILDLDANPLDPDRPLAELDGVGYFAAAKPGARADRHMVKVARDDADRHFFYQYSLEIGGGGVEEGSDLFLKIGSGRYIKVVTAGDLGIATGAGAGS